jgi:hypothetical protein
MLYRYVLLNVVVHSNEFDFFCPLVCPELMVVARPPEQGLRRTSALTRV